MFTGIIEEIGNVQRLQKVGNGYQLAVRAKTVLGGTKLGDSIAINGVCLTVTQLGSDYFTVGLAPETRNRTNILHLKAGSAVNLERALLPTSRMGGHFVQGHVDSTGEITAFERDEDALWVTIAASPDVMRYVVPKGFIALDGVSLTVVDVTESYFTVHLVAYTQQEIVLPQKQVGYDVNIEVDVLGKYVEKMIANQFGAGTGEKRPSGMTLDFLAANGFG